MLVLLLWTGHEMTSYMHSTGLSACLATNAGCDTATHLFENRYGGLLRNILYIGEICHKGVIYPDEQPAIVERALWARVQRQLKLDRAKGARHRKVDA